jgi:hypothetical protein
VKDRGNSFDTLDAGHDWVDVDSTADSNGITLPIKGTTLVAQRDDMANIVRSTTNFVSLCVTLDHRPEGEVGGVVLEILDVDFRGNEVGGIVWKTKVGESSQIL